MKTALTILKWSAIIGVPLIIGAAYGHKIPVVKQAAKALPKSQVL